MGLFVTKHYRSMISGAVKLVAGALLILSLAGCAGGSLMSPQPMNGRDRLVFRIVDQTAGITYYTRNMWFDGDSYVFHDVYGRDVVISKSDQVAVDIIGAAAYYQTPE